MRKSLKTIVVILLLLTMLLPSFVFATKIRDVESLPESNKLKNPYKAWSVAKGLGMTDESAAGFLGNMQAESSFDPTTIEGIFGEYNDITKPGKANAIKDFCSYTRNKLFPMYARSGWGLSASSDRHGHSVDRVESSKGSFIQTGAYVGMDGHYAPGIGLLGFTGNRTSKLLLWSKKYNVDWFTMETQLTYMLIKEDSDGYIDGKADWIFNKYIPAKHSSPEEAAEDWCRVFEGVTVHLDKRKKFARQWYDRFKGDPGDTKYAKKILAAADAPFKLNHARKDILDKSIIHELMGPVIEFPQSRGFLYDYDKDKDEHAKIAATNILKSIATGEELTTEYSLYDLFGSDINWYRYFGEATQPVKLLDHVWSAYDQNKMQNVTLGDTIFYKSTRYLSCNVYRNRPTVLSVDSLNEGRQDPRVTTILNGIFTGGDYVSSSLNLGASKAVVGLISYLMGPDLFDTLNKILKDIFETSIWTDVMLPIVWFITSIAMVGFIVSLVVKAKNYALGRDFAKSVLKRFLVGFFCLMILFTFAYQPVVFSDFVNKAATILDDIFNTVLTMTYTADEVIGSTDGKHTTEAALWKTAIFEPWCIGQFGDRYENLYTQFSNKPTENKMKQSYLTEAEMENIKLGEYKFSSATYTGDVFVPVGGGKEIRNWAAYLYSCNSKYHIDFNYLDGTTEVPEKITFPNMMTTAYNSQVAADTFRVIDAQHNISPQIFADGATNTNYTDANLVEYHFKSQSRLMLLYAFMLAVTFLPAIIMKVYFLFLLAITGVRLIFASIKELAKEGQGLPHVKDKLLEYGSKYFIAVLRLYVLTVTYVLLVGKSFVQSFLYLLIALVVYFFNYDKLRRTIQAKPISTRLKRLKRGVKNNM